MSAPFQIPGPGAVVVVWKAWARAVATVLGGAVLVGMAWAVVGAVAAGDPARPWRSSGLGTTGVVVGWVVVAVLAAVLVLGIVVAWRTRLEIGAGGVAARLTGSGVARYPTSAVETVRYRRPRGQATMAPRPGAVQVVLRDARGRRRTLSLIPALMTTTEATFDVVLGWVRARPELVRDADTAAVLGVPAPRA